MNLKNLYIFATMIELMGISLTSAAIAYEFIAKADLGFIVMNLGCLLIACGSLIFAKVAPWLRGEYES
ncbi:MAG: hypothetical protein QXQ24_05475 [Nitrososphaeria archaeon]